VDGDGFALISKVHHCLADGMAGLAIIGTLVNPDPEFVPEPAPDWVPRPAPGDAELVIDEVRRRALAPAEALGAQLRRATGGASSGSSPSLTALRDLMVSSTGGASDTPLNRPIGPHRRFDWLRLPFDGVHEIGARAGGKINDVVLALTAGALRDFLAHRDVDVDHLELRTVVPVNIRNDEEGSEMGNHVANLIVPLPVDEADPWRRLERVVETTAELKRSGSAVGFDALGPLIDLLPSPLLGPVVRLGSQSTPANLAVSNLPGPRMPMYLLGARQREAYPVLPLIGNQALGIVLISHEDSLCWGLNADWDAVPDLHDLVERLEDGYTELADLVLD
jgi:WS/DGAT/MGAT family acyltransferase